MQKCMTFSPKRPCGDTGTCLSTKVNVLLLNVKMTKQFTCLYSAVILNIT